MRKYKNPTTETKKRKEEVRAILKKRFKGCKNYYTECHAVRVDIMKKYKIGYQVALDLIRDICNEEIKYFNPLDRNYKIITQSIIAYLGSVRETFDPFKHKEYKKRFGHYYSPRLSFKRPLKDFDQYHLRIPRLSFDDKFLLGQYDKYIALKEKATIHSFPPGFISAKHTVFHNKRALERLGVRVDG